MSVLSSTEINHVSIICWHLTKVFPAHLTEPHYVPLIPALCMSQLVKFSSWPQSFHIPCSNRDVLLTSNCLDLWYTSGIVVTYAPVSNIKARSLLSRTATDPVLRCYWCCSSCCFFFFFGGGGGGGGGRVQLDRAHPVPGCLLWPQPKSTITVAHIW